MRRTIFTAILGGLIAATSIQAYAAGSVGAAGSTGSGAAGAAAALVAAREQAGRQPA
jgi:hypothetical protein